MKYQWKQLSLWFLLFYLVTDIVGSLFDSESISASLEHLLQPNIIFLSFTGGLVFFLYAAYAYFIFKKWHHKQPIWVILPLIFLGSLCIVGLRYLLEEVLSRTFFGFGNYRPDISLTYYFLDNLYYVFQYAGLGIIFYFWQYSRWKEERNHQLETENQKMELALLRGQTNPHFLFNMLNNIYSLVFNQSDRALGAIEKLSSLLRYSLYETKEMVTVEEELSQIKNFIELETMRHSQSPEVKWDIQSGLDQMKLPQFMLLPLVENAFKHGNINSNEHPITIQLSQEGQQLIYSVSNEMSTKQKDGVGGIGVENLTKRLQLLYADRHTFTSNQHDNVYFTQLKIPVA